MSFPEKDFKDFVKSWFEHKLVATVSKGVNFDFLSFANYSWTELKTAARWGFEEGYKQGVEDGATGQLKKKVKG